MYMSFCSPVDSCVMTVTAASSRCHSGLDICNKQMNTQFLFASSVTEMLPEKPYHTVLLQLHKFLISQTLCTLCTLAVLFLHCQLHLAWLLEENINFWHAFHPSSKILAISWTVLHFPKKIRMCCTEGQRRMVDLLSSTLSDWQYREFATTTLTRRLIGISASN